MTQFVEKISRHIVMVLFTLIIGGLTAISLINTCYLNSNEHTYYTFETPYNIFILLCCIGILFVIFYKCRNWIASKVTIRSLLLIALLIGISYAMISQVHPKADQKVCLSVAEQMHQGNYEAFEEGNYMQAYPQQVGIVLVYYFLGFLFGPRNIVALHLVNVFAYVWFLYGSYKVTKHLFKTETLACCCTMLCMLFLPLLLYTSFLYGTMIGLAASTYAFYMAMVYMETGKRMPAILCAFFAGLAVLVKKNYLIVVIALLLILVIHAFCKKHLRALLCVVLLFASYLCFTSGAKAVTEKITCTTIGDGLPSIAWVTMGLQDGGRASGWYNRYSVDVYQDNDNDTKKTAESAKATLKKQIHTMVRKPKYTAAFFTKKTASQWSEPSFESFFILRDPVMNISESPILSWITKKNGNAFLLYYLDLLQSLVYLGVFLFAIYEWKNLKLWDLFPAIIFLGGFIFHLFWEAKGQYTLCYFVLLFPYCLKGYSRLFYKIKSFIQKKKEMSLKPMAASFAPLLLFFGFGILYSVAVIAIPPVKTSVAKANSTYSSYLASLDEKVIPMNGTYRLQTPDRKQFLTFTKDKNGTITALLSPKKSSKQYIRIKDGKGGRRITAKKLKQPLNAIPFTKVVDPTLERRKSYYDTNTHFTFSLVEHEDGTYGLRTSDGYALTHHKDGSVTLESYHVSKTLQRWKLTEIPKSKKAESPAPSKLH